MCDKNKITHKMIDICECGEIYFLNDYEVNEVDTNKNKIKHKCERCGNVHLMWEEYNEKTNITTWHVKTITERYNKC